MGVEKPERITAGTRNRKAPSTACCCVTVMAEIIRPMPTAESRNSTRPRYNAPRLPRTGISKKITISTIISVASSRPMTMPGMAFPISISTGRRGVTSSWSKVPASRSRATESAVTNRVTTRVSRPTMPGTINQRDCKFSLYQARICRVTSDPPSPRDASQSRL